MLVSLSLSLFATGHAPKAEAIREKNRKTFCIAQDPVQKPRGEGIDLGRSLDWFDR